MADPKEPYRVSKTKIPTTGAECPKKAAFIDELVKKTEPKATQDPRMGMRPRRAATK